MQRGTDCSAVLQELLAEAEKTQDDLAKRSGITRVTVNGYVTGRLRLGRRNAERLAEAFSAWGVTDAASRLLPPAEADPWVELLDRLEQLEARLASLEGEVMRRLGPERFRGLPRDAQDARRVCR